MLHDSRGMHVTEAFVLYTLKQKFLFVVLRNIWVIAMEDKRLSGIRSFRGQQTH